MKWALLALLFVFLMLVISGTERFVDTEFKSGGATGVATSVTRPCECSSGKMCESKCQAWESKVNAHAPSGAITKDYISVLDAFYDTVYNPATTKPTEKQVNTFLGSSAGTVAGVDLPSLKRMIMDGFHIDSETTAAAGELASQKFIPDDSILEDIMARDEVRTRTEGDYTPAVPKSSTRFSEGDYAPVTQTSPIHPDQEDDSGSTSWKGVRPASVPASAENVI